MFFWITSYFKLFRLTKCTSYALAFLTIFHLMLGVPPISLINHASVDRAVLCLYLSRLKEGLWPEKRFLKVPSSGLLTLQRKTNISSWCLMWKISTQTDDKWNKSRQKNFRYQSDGHRNHFSCTKITFFQRGQKFDKKRRQTVRHYHGCIRQCRGLKARRLLYPAEPIIEIQQGKCWYIQGRRPGDMQEHLRPTERKK